ncbi:MAG: aminoacyl-tRNA hydrolase [Burkholderiaceae bacterium]|nr:aminoacyl-tRNA hydrolase [Roseateles sp.]MBV8470449.1 aminoacyl-tRNA hydrolase [Burkholderiaceae bacterium]
MHPDWQPAPHELKFSAMRASGPGGQNVNKVSSAVHLRFDIPASSLPEALKARLLTLQDQRISSEGVLLIKAQTHRSQDRNRSDALARLMTLVRSVARPPKTRHATQPTWSSRQQRMAGKARRSSIKAGRSRIRED